jgi:5-formyltetrahydrofolate cyclo-ligase
MTDLSELRRHLRQIRRALGVDQRRHATEAALGHLAALPEYQDSHRIALYVGSDGELCPLALAEQAASMNKLVCLPVLHPGKQGELLFMAWEPGSPLQTNRFGIPEPPIDPGNRVDATTLDLVVTPLLGFDDRGHRLGMGGGYYDRTFAFRIAEGAQPRPWMVGLAHSAQRVERIDRQPWDVALDMVVTQDGVQRFVGN